VAMCSDMWTMPASGPAGVYEMACSNTAAHTSAFYRWNLTAEGILASITLPNEILSGNVTFVLETNKGGNVLITIPPACRAVDQGRLPNTDYTGPQQVFSKTLWHGCLLDCNAPVHAETLPPHLRATCDPSIPAWKITGTVKSDEFTRELQSPIFIEGNLESANSDMPMLMASCAHITVTGTISLNSTSIGLNAEFEGGAPLAGHMIHRLFRHPPDALTSPPSCFQLDPPLEGCCPNLMPNTTQQDDSTHSHDVHFNCDGTACNHNVDCAPTRPSPDDPASTLSWNIGAIVLLFSMIFLVNF